MIKVIMSCDDNPYYLDFWNDVSKTWKKVIDITPVLIHVGDPNIDISKKYGEVHHIPIDKNLPVHTQAQLARLWYPTQEPDTLWITSDIDMFPMSRSYWNEVVMNWTATQPDWTNLNSEGDYFPICYHLALGKMFDKVLGIDGDSFHSYVNKVIDEVDENQVHTPEGWNGPALTKWNVDEVFSSKKIMEFKEEGGRVVQKTQTINRRIDRADWKWHPQLIQAGFYIDCHSLRPHSDHHKEIHQVLGLATP
jgi:hypothetical protein